MRARLFPLALFLSLTTLLVVQACSAVTGNGSSSFGGGGSTGSPASTGAGDGSATASNSSSSGCLIGCGDGGLQQGDGGPVSGQLSISPQNPKLTITNGTIPTQVFKAVVNGTDVSNQVTWSFDRPDIGDVASKETFTPTGLVGGLGNLTATYNKSSVTTSVSVTIKSVVNTGGLTAAQQTAFNKPNAGPDTIQLVYPYLDTVFPLGVLTPQIQWNGGGATDYYELKLTEKYYQFVEYFTIAPPAVHVMPQDAWVKFENSGAGSKTDPVTVSLTRQSGAQVFNPVTSTWHVAQGSLLGSVYYWELPDQCGDANGKILRIKPSSAVADQFFPSNDCYGCHTVSRDGTTMMAAFSLGVPFPQYSIDLTQNPAVQGASINLGGTFMAFNDTGTKLLASDDSDSDPTTDVLKIVDPKTGVVYNPNAMGSGCGEPAWSPDGKMIAAICGLSGGGWIFDATSGYLAVANVAANGFTVTNVTQIVAQAGGAGRPAYPTFSPGSEYIAFGRPTAGSRSTSPGTIWLTDTKGSFIKNLMNAAGDGASFNPVFAPLRAGGYFWFVFMSRRDYGNQLVGANGGQGRNQLWIAAIDDPPTAADPSHPAFYLRGQEPCGFSENAYYALDPCKALGAGCMSGVDCCNGQCLKDPKTMMFVCGTPPAMGPQCSQNGNACKTTADCCDATNLINKVQCLDGFCQLVPPP